MDGGRYRLRTRLRGALPAAIATRIPKGHADCGDHEWYRADESTWRCYHCQPGVTSVSPFTPEEDALGRLRALDHIYAALAREPNQGHEDVTERYIAVLAEMHDLLHTAPVEERVFGGHAEPPGAVA